MSTSHGLENHMGKYAPGHQQALWLRSISSYSYSSRSLKAMLLLYTRCNTFVRSNTVLFNLAAIRRPGLRSQALALAWFLVQVPVCFLTIDPVQYDLQGCDAPPKAGVGLACNTATSRSEAYAASRFEVLDYCVPATLPRNAWDEIALRT